MNEIAGRNIVVTGGASGIGKGMCERFAAMGAANIVIADLDLDGATTAAAAITAAHEPCAAVAKECNVADNASVKQLIDGAIAEIGHIDLFFANAGVGTGSGLDASDDVWDLTWKVNVMGPVIAARHVVPHMSERGGGRFVITASSAGLTTGPVSFNYAVTKHAAVGVAEWVAINHGTAVTVQTICPTIVDTPMAAEFGEVMFEPMSVDDVVDSIIDGLETGSFIIAPGPKPMEMFQAKADDWDGFIATMQDRVESMKHD